MWHLSEEVEHRTVTFDAYDHVVGRHPYRVAVGGWAQAHFLRSLLRMAAVLQRDTIDADVSMRRVVAQAAKRNWENGTIPGTLRAVLPSYDPRLVPIHSDVRMIAASQGVVIA